MNRIMAEPDEDDDAQVEQADDEDREPGTEGEGADGEDTGGREDEPDLSAERADAADDEGAPSSRAPAQSEAQSRGSARLQRLANENREVRQKLEQLERDRENERQQWLRQQQQVTEQQDRERMALMTPEERAEYRVTRHQQTVDTQLRNMQLQTAMQMDKTSYEAKAAVNPVYRRMRDQVENMFQEQVRKGAPTDRETILYHLLGRQAANGASNPKPRQQARRRVEAQRVKASSSRSDTARGEQRSGKMSAAEERLKDVLI